MQIKPKLFLPLLLIALLPACSKDPVLSNPEKPQKPKGITQTEQDIYEKLTSNRELKVITLPNQLKVAIISDPKAGSSSASMDVGVGELSNPAKYRGLAHYLEHMLFLGTKANPIPGTFDSFLSQNGGSSNAYTSDENTNFHFVVNHDGFEAALDGFSHFFVDPVFNADYIPKEIKNVDSEYQKNRESTMWRWQYLRHNLVEDGSPFKNDFQGSIETLGNVPREVLMNFYNTYYSANQMKLAVISPLPLDKLEALVREKFAAVPNRNAPKQDFAGISTGASKLPRQVEFKTSDDLRMVTLSFSLPSDKGLWASKPLDLIDQELSYFGQGSLVASLKQRGLLQGLQTNSDSRTYGSAFDIILVLTEKGSAEYKNVVKEVFAELKEIKARGLKKEIFDDKAQMAKLHYLYDSPLRGDKVSTYSAWMRTYGGEDIEGKMRLYTKYDADAFQSYISLFTPERATIYVANPEIKGETKADFYDIEYTEKSLAKDPWLEELKNVPAGAYTLLEKNPFVTNDTTLVDANGREAKRLLVNEFGALWVSPAITPIPKAHISLSLIKPSQGGAHEAAISELYEAAQQKVIDEWSDNASTAGISVKIASSPQTYEVEIEGFSEKLGAFTADLAGKLKELKVSGSDFADLQDELQANVEQSKKIMAYKRGKAQFSGLYSVGSVDLDLYGPEIAKVTPDELNAYAQLVPAQSSLEMKVFGNISDEGAKGIFQAVAAKLGTVAVAPEARKPYDWEVSIPAGESYGFAQTGETNNGVWIAGFQLGSITPETVAFTNLAAVFFDQPFYKEMRTNRSLGYIVSAGGSLSSTSAWLKFVIQSEKTPDELAQLVLPWVRDQVAAAQNLSDADFAGLKKGLLASLRSPIDSMDMDVSIFQKAVNQYGEDFQFRSKVADAIEKATKDSFVASLANALGEKTQRRLSLYVGARGTALSEMKGETKITSVAEFQQAIPKVAHPIAK